MCDNSAKFGMHDVFLCILAGCDADIHVIVKIESADSIPNLHSIITASDGVTTESLIASFSC